MYIQQVLMQEEALRHSSIREVAISRQQILKKKWEINTIWKPPG